MPQQQQRGKPAPPPPPQLGFNVRPPPASEDEPVDLSELGPIKTTKQIHKEYLARTRISKEEAKRQVQQLREEERQERELRKKEAEKAKASNRARFLREKKKAKEEQARDELRKQGLPTVPVHPSQATISGWFVKGNGAGNKRRVDEVEDAEGAEQPLKRTHIDEPERPSETAEATTVPRSIRPSQAPRSLRPSQAPRSQALPERPSEMAEATTAPQAPQQALPIRASPKVAALEPLPGTPSLLAGIEDLLPSSTQVARELAEEWAAPIRPPSPPPVVRAAPVPKVRGGASRSPFEHMVGVGGFFTAQHAKDFARYDKVLDNMLIKERAKEAQRKAMPPPPKTAPKPAHRPAHKPAPKPASKTVLTVNQLGKPKPASAVNNLARQIGSLAAAPVAAASKMVSRIKNSLPFLTQDLVLSTQDVREIEGTATKPKAKGIVDRIKNSVLSFCSQDLALSTQDIREVEGPTTKPRAKGAVPPAPKQQKPPSRKSQSTNTHRGGQLARANKTSLSESFYDDDDFDDGAALELLEKIESGAKTPALVETAPTKPDAPEKAAGGGDSVEDLMGSGSWLSDDGELDL